MIHDQIRIAVEKDLDDIYYLAHETIKESYKEFYTAEQITFFDDYHSHERILDDIMKGYVIVCTRGERIFATGTIRGSDIRRVFVKPGLQGGGTGKLIMKDLEREARGEGLDFVDLYSSLPAKRFYDSLGYKTLEYFDPGEVGRLEPDYYRMAKMLRVIDHQPIVSLKGAVFKMTEYRGNGMEFFEQALFHFKQVDEIVIGKFKGGRIARGEIIGFIEGNKFISKSIHFNTDGKIVKGFSRAEIKVDSESRVSLLCSWKWAGSKDEGYCCLTGD